MMVNMKTEEVTSLSIQEVCSLLRTNPHVGLSSLEAEHRRKIYGHNDFEISEDDPLWKKYLDQVSLLTFPFDFRVSQYAVSIVLMPLWMIPNKMSFFRSSRIR